MNTFEEIIDYFVKKKKKNFSWHTVQWWHGDNYQVEEGTMSAWYKEAKEIWNIACHYDVFRDCVEREIYYDRKAYLKERRSNKKYTQKNGAFRKAAHHKKKILSDKEKDKRERAKRRRQHKHKGIRWHHDSRGWLWYQITANRKERRQVKSKLRNGYFDKHYDGWKITGTNGCYKEYNQTDWDDYSNDPRRAFLDPWDYY